MSRRPLAAAALAGAVTLAGCAPRLGAPDALPAGAAADPAAELAEVLALASRTEDEPDGAVRAGLVERAVAAAQRCQAAEPASPRCDYALAVALGVRARERPATAAEALSRMPALLRRAAAAAPGLDRAGPDRVLALFLLRAPGWPLGPGSAEDGLAAAERAVAAAPDHPPNLLALAEARLACGEEAAAREAAVRAAALAEQARRAGEPEAGRWLREARRLGAR